VPLERPQIGKPEGDVPFDLGIEDIVVGDGDEATKGKKFSVHYVGVSFSTGEEFDASWNRGQSFEFKVGKGQVIPGWDAGVQGTSCTCASRPGDPAGGPHRPEHREAATGDRHPPVPDLRAAV
jgi:hypothetical protein